MKWVDKIVSFSEVPDEVCLCINISNCPYHCPGCHSSYLAQDIGEELTPEVLDSMVEKNSGITCVCLMGGKEDEIATLIHNAKYSLKGIKTAWYTGQKNIPDFVTLMSLDYVKVGPYISELGPLTSRTTNQKFYRIDHIHTPLYETGPCATLHDITSKFWKDEDF